MGTFLDLVNDPPLLELRDKSRACKPRFIIVIAMSAILYIDLLISRIIPG